jgi:acid phosphatase
VDRCLVIVMWDEDDSSQSNQVLTIFAGSAAQSGVVSATRHDHFDVLRTIEQFFGLPTLTANDAGAAPMTELLR